MRRLFASSTGVIAAKAATTAATTVIATKVVRKRSKIDNSHSIIDYIVRKTIDRQENNQFDRK